MPVYLYKCHDCETEFKSFHGVDDKQICLKCNSENLVKQFKGNSLNVTAKNSTPKERVEKFIEETRVAVAEQIAEARKEIK